MTTGFLHERGRAAMGDVAVASLLVHSSRKAVEGRLMKTDTGQGQAFPLALYDRDAVLGR